MPRSLRVLTVPGVLVALLVLSGCVPTDDTGAEPTPTASSPDPRPTPTITGPVATPTADPQATPVTIPCDQIITLDAMYAYDPNFSLLEDVPFAADTLVGEAVAAQGVACRWYHNTNGLAIDVAVAQPAPGELAAKKAEAVASGTVVDAYGAEGYFAVIDGAGTAQAFPGEYWVIVTSPLFSSPEDVTALVDAVIGSVG